MRVTRHLYLTNPTALTKLDWDNPERLFEQLSLSQHNSMEEYGWVLLGSATVNFAVERTYEQLVADAVARGRELLAKLDAEHQAKRAVAEEAINKLLAIGFVPR